MSAGRGPNLDADAPDRATAAPGADRGRIGPPLALRRVVRMSLDLHGNLAADISRPRENTYAGWPASAGFGLYLEVSLVVCGEPDPGTGYLVDIGAVDQVVRQIVLNRLCRPCTDFAPGPLPSQRSGDPTATGTTPAPPCALDVRSTTPAQLLRCLLDESPSRLGRHVTSAQLALTPFHVLYMSTTSPDRVLLTQRFEFAASHRLHCRDLSDERNRQIFGKCNNPNGHGHNYRVDVAVEGVVDGHGMVQPDLHRIETIVRSSAIDRLDHRHLNLDVPEFERLNPSVENIARVIHGFLTEPLEAAGGTLRSVTVWETEKTCCTYPA